MLVLLAFQRYYAMCAETDFLLGRVLDALRDSGEYDNTYIVFVSDHGEMNMEHRQVWKNSMYEVRLTTLSRALTVNVIVYGAVRY